MDGPAGAIALRSEYTEAFRLQGHKMLAQARQYVLKGYRLSVSRGPNERRPFGRVWLYRPLDDQRAYKATTHASGATPEPDKSLAWLLLGSGVVRPGPGSWAEGIWCASKSGSS